MMSKYHHVGAEDNNTIQSGLFKGHSGLVGCTRAKESPVRFFDLAII